MKKFFISVLVVSMCFMFTGCANEALNMDKIVNNVKDMKNNEYSVYSINMALAKKNVFYNMTLTDYYDFKDKFGLDIKYMDNGLIAESEKDGIINNYIAIKIVEEYSKKEKRAEAITFINNEISKYKNNLKQRLENENKEPIVTDIYLEHGDVLIYLISNNKDTINDYQDISKNLVNDGKIDFMFLTNNIDKNNIKQRLDIDASYLEEFAIVLPQNDNQANFYIVVKPNKQAKKNVEEKIETYINKLIDKFKKDDVDKYKIIKKYQKERFGDYLIYVSSKDNDLLLKKIKQSK